MQGWRGHEIGDRLRVVGFSDLIGTEHTVQTLLEAIAADGLAIVDDVPLDMASTRRVLERIGYVRSTIFGTMWSIRSDGQYDDTASTNLEISPHTDGTYSHDAPGLLGFHCHRPADSGGETVLVDGFAIAERLRATEPDVFGVLSSVEIPWQYIGDGSHLVSHRPVIRLDAAGTVRQISYNNHDRAPFHLPEPRMKRLYEALRIFDRMIREPAEQFILGLDRGSMLLFDNWRLLHARCAFAGPRHLTGGYLNHEDFESRLRRFRGNPLDMIDS